MTDRNRVEYAPANPRRPSGGVGEPDDAPERSRSTADNGRISTAPLEDVAVVVGTRPEIIKMAPVIRALDSMDSCRQLLVHTNQHYDDSLSAVFFENLELPQPDIDLHVGSGSHGQQTAKALAGIEELLQEQRLDVVLAQGDTNAVLSTALAASKLPLPFGHVEAGIRSFDRSMPEEINRVVADQVADFLFAPTEVAVDNLDDEGITDGVFLTGNTVVDACRKHAAIAERQSDVLERLELDVEGYAAATIHRPRNTDDAGRLRQISAALDSVEFPVVFPAHPRTRTRLDEIDYHPSNVIVLEPLDYLDFLELEANARVVVTDSGGIQEEASILEVPCLTVRPNTERPETVEAGVNELVEPEALADRLIEVYENDRVHDAMTGEPDLFGDGKAGPRIVDYLIEAL